MKEFDLSHKPRIKRGVQATLSGLLLFSGAVGSIIAPPFAYAGNWVLDRYEASGSNVIDPPIANKPNPEIWPAPAAGDTSYGAYTSAEKSSSGGSATFSASAKSSGTITAVFKWIPNQGQTLETDPPPAYLNVLVNTSVGSYTRHSVNGSATTTAQTNLNNGFENQAQTRTPTNDSVGINARRLVRVPAGSEEVSVSYGLSSDNKIICTPTKLTGNSGYTYYNASGYVGIDASVWMQAQEDPRSVWISSPTIEESYWKESLRRTAHVRNPDMSIHTDSAVEWQVGCARCGYSSGWHNHSVFNAVTPGFSEGTQFDWDADDVDVPTLNTSNGGRTLDLWQEFGPQVNQFPKTSVIKVTATDPVDQAVGKNTFSVTWHLPFEPIGAAVIKDEFEKVRQIIAPFYDGCREVPLEEKQKFNIAAGLEGVAGAAGAMVGGPSGAAAAFSIA